MHPSEQKRSLDEAFKSVERALSYPISKIGLVKILCFGVLVYCLVTSLAPAPVGVLEQASKVPCVDSLNWCICPREAVCATSISDMILLVIARGSIYAVYPFILLMFLTKARHLNALLKNSIYSPFFGFEDTHNLHKTGGRIVEIATWIHVIFHLIRWGTRGDIGLLINHVTGQTGLFAIVIMPLITFPMNFESIKKRLDFQYRKLLHYLSWFWGLAIVFHAPAVNVFWIMGSALLIYIIDWLLSTHKFTYLVESTKFRKLGKNTLLSFTNPEGFQLQSASYVLVMLPWISNTQWHAFSVFPHPTLKNTSSVCMAAIGDWTRELHEIIERPTARPAWICGPFLSPFATALNYDNIITIASGIGITPALAVLDRYKKVRRINLIWSCRDAALIEFFVNMVEFPDDAFIFIFYTGKTPLSLGKDAPPNVLVFKGRPNLDKVITGMIYRIETNCFLPEDIVQEGHDFRELSTSEKGKYLITRIVSDYDPEEFYEAASVEVPKHLIDFTPKKEPSIDKLDSEPTIRQRNIAEFTTGLHSKLNGSTLAPIRAPPTNNSEDRHGSLFTPNSVDSTQSQLRRGSFELPKTGAHPQSQFVKSASTRLIGVRERSQDYFGKKGRSRSISTGLNEINTSKKPRRNVLFDRRQIANYGITMESFSTAIQDFFGNIMYSEEEIKNVFKMIDESGKGYLNEEEFLDYCDDFSLKMLESSSSIDVELGARSKTLWVADSKINRQPNRIKKSDFISAKSGSKEDKNKESYETQQKYMKENKDILKTWEMLYCGGSKPIVDSLKHVSKEYEIDLRIEKFDW